MSVNFHQIHLNTFYFQDCRQSNSGAARMARDTVYPTLGGSPKENTLKVNERPHASRAHAAAHIDRAHLFAHTHHARKVSTNFIYTRSTKSAPAEYSYRKRATAASSDNYYYSSTCTLLFGGVAANRARSGWLLAPASCSYNKRATFSRVRSAHLLVLLDSTKYNLDRYL